MQELLWTVALARFDIPFGHDEALISLEMVLESTWILLHWPGQVENHGEMVKALVSGGDIPLCLKPWIVTCIGVTHVVPSGDFVEGPFAQCWIWALVVGALNGIFLQGLEFEEQLLALDPCPETLHYGALEHALIQFGQVEQLTDAWQIGDSSSCCFGCTCLHSQ